MNAVTARSHVVGQSRGGVGVGAIAVPAPVANSMEMGVGMSSIVRRGCRVGRASSRKAQLQATLEQHASFGRAVMVAGQV
eukprot:50912-Prymnesium_polylepis.2